MVLHHLVSAGKRLGEFCRTFRRTSIWWSDLFLTMQACNQLLKANLRFPQLRRGGQRANSEQFVSSPAYSPSPAPAALGPPPARPLGPPPAGPIRAVVSTEPSEVQVLLEELKAQRTEAAAERKERDAERREERDRAASKGCAAKQYHDVGFPTSNLCILQHRTCVFSSKKLCILRFLKECLIVKTVYSPTSNLCILHQKLCFLRFLEIKLVYSPPKMCILRFLTCRDFL